FELALSSRDLPPLTMKVIDLAAVLNSNYRADLASRLKRLAEKSGYAIHIVLIPGSYQRNLIDITANQFELKKSEMNGSAGTVLVIITTHDSRVAIITSRNLRRTLSWSHYLETRIQRIMQHHAKEPEQAIEYSVNAILVAIDPWFYVLPFPAGNFSGLIT